MAKLIGPTFGDEILAAHLNGLPFSWGEDGVFEFHPSMTQAQNDAVLAVYAAHDPTKQLPDPKGKAKSALAKIADKDVRDALQAILDLQ